MSDAAARCRRWLEAALVAASLSLAALPALASDLDNVKALNLPVIAGDFPVYYSPSAEAEAKVYAATLAKAVAWYRSALGWRDPVAMAVLNPSDFALVSYAIPYPVPYAETGTGLVVMPDRIDSFPGFDRWDLEPVALNAALTLHEIGHIIAHQTGIVSGNHWINELIANVFLAGYARAENPAFAVLLGGVPPRFTEFGQHTALVDLDALYASVGLLNYAWFQFRIAALADYLVTGRDFAAVIDGLRREFPAALATGETMSTTFARLETIAPGITVRAGDLAGPSTLPLIAIDACRTAPPASDDGDTLVIVENRSDAVLVLNSRSRIDYFIGVELMLGMSEADQDQLALTALTDFRYADEIDPRTTEMTTTLRQGEQVTIKNGGCFIVPAGASRFVWTGK